MTVKIDVGKLSMSPYKSYLISAWHKLSSFKITLEMSVKKTDSQFINKITYPYIIIGFKTN